MPMSSFRNFQKAQQMAFSRDVMAAEAESIVRQSALRNGSYNCPAPKVARVLGSEFESVAEGSPSVPESQGGSGLG